MVTNHQKLIREVNYTGNGSGGGFMRLLFPDVVELICDGDSERTDEGVFEKATPLV